MKILAAYILVFGVFGVSLAFDRHPAQTYEVKRPYSFSYGVKDDNMGLDFGRNEESDGQVTVGSYSVLLPDGRIQTVKYEADHVNGFVAEVSYSGEAKYPSPYGEQKQEVESRSVKEPSNAQTFHLPTAQRPEKNFGKWKQRLDSPHTIRTSHKTFNRDDKHYPKPHSPSFNPSTLVSVTRRYNESPVHSGSPPRQPSRPSPNNYFVPYPKNIYSSKYFQGKKIAPPTNNEKNYNSEDWKARNSASHQRQVTKQAELDDSYNLQQDIGFNFPLSKNKLTENLVNSFGNQEIHANSQTSNNYKTYDQFKGDETPSLNANYRLPTFGKSYNSEPSPYLEENNEPGYTLNIENYNENEEIKNFTSDQRTSQKITEPQHQDEEEEYSNISDERPNDLPNKFYTEREITEKLNSNSKEHKVHYGVGEDTYQATSPPGILLNGLSSLEPESVNYNEDQIVKQSQADVTDEDYQAIQDNYLELDIGLSHKNSTSIANDNYHVESQSQGLTKPFPGALFYDLLSLNHSKFEDVETENQNKRDEQLIPNLETEIKNDGKDELVPSVEQLPKETMQLSKYDDNFEHKFLTPRTEDLETGVNQLLEHQN